MMMNKEEEDGVKLLMQQMLNLENIILMTYDNLKNGIDVMDNLRIMCGLIEKHRDDVLHKSSIVEEIEAMLKDINCK